MTKKDLHSMSTREMIHCESCGGYHTLEDSEIVVIKIIKGKGCDMPKAEPKTVYVDRPNVIDRPVQPVDVVVPPVPPAPPKKKIIPPGLLAMMIDPANPHFEALGAKETRRV